jgi:hypothetical protein
MPVLHQYVEQPGLYVKCHIKGTFVTFQLTSDGAGRLFAAGFKSDDKFPLRLLIDLIHRGEAYTFGSGVTPAEFSVGQLEFDFPDDREAERLFPVCNMDGAYDDLHLIVHEQASKTITELLCPRCRKTVGVPSSLSIPVIILTIDSLKRLESQKKISADQDAIKSLYAWFKADAAEYWEKIAKAKRRPDQGGLDFNEPGKLL